MLQFKMPLTTDSSHPDNYESKKTALKQQRTEYMVSNEYRVAVLATLRLNVFRELTLLAWLLSLEHLRQRLALSRCVFVYVHTEHAVLLLCSALQPSLACLVQRTRYCWQGCCPPVSCLSAVLVKHTHFRAECPH